MQLDYQQIKEMYNNNNNNIWSIEIRSIRSIGFIGRTTYEYYNNEQEAINRYKEINWGNNMLMAREPDKLSQLAIFYLLTCQ